MKTFKISVVIPLFNEEMRLHKTFTQIRSIPRLFDSLKNFRVKEIIFVNDGSTDKTLTSLNQFYKTRTFPLRGWKIISYKTNQGKGYAVRRGMLKASGDYVLLMDADASTKLSEFKKLVPFVLNHKKIIIGTRKNGQSTVVVHQPRLREIMGRGFTGLASLVLNTWVTDFTCGFKLFEKQAAREIFSLSKIRRFGYDAEILYLARILGYEICEKALVWRDDKRTKVNLWQDSIRSFWELLMIRYNSLTGSYRPRLYGKNTSKIGLVRRYAPFLAS